MLKGVKKKKSTNSACTKPKKRSQGTKELMAAGRRCRNPFVLESGQRVKKKKLVQRPKESTDVSVKRRRKNFSRPKKKENSGR